jgi:hypothetical protein
MRRRLGLGRALSIGLSVSLLLALTVGASMLPAGGQSTANPKTNRFAPSGAVSVEPATEAAGTARAQAAPQTATAQSGAIPPAVTGTSGCHDADDGNVGVNQECTNQSGAGFLGRGQSQNETAVAVNPRDPSNILAAQNDYRRGDSACGADSSLDGGRHWGSELLPLSFTAPGFPTPAFPATARHYWHASGDPSVAFDSSGEAYAFCLAFDRAPPVSDVQTSASGLFLLRRRRRLLELPRQRRQAGRRDRRHRPARQELHGDRHRPPQPLPRPHLRRLGRVQPELLGRPGRLRLLRGPRRDLARQQRHQRRLGDPVPQRLRRLGGRHLQRKPVPTAVRGPQRRRLRGVPELQQCHLRPERQPQPDADREVDRRRRQLRRAGQGERLVRPARLPDLHRPRPRPGVRGDRPRLRPEHLPGHQLSVRGGA